MVTSFSLLDLETTKPLTLLAFGSATNPIYDGKCRGLQRDKLLTTTRIYVQELILLEIKTSLLSLSIIEPIVSILQVK
jgi:hypothetical protein